MENSTDSREALVAKLSTNAETGLSEAEVVSRRERYGENKMQ